MHVKADPKTDEMMPVVGRGHAGAERALTPGPWHQDWPFHCFYCGDKYTDHTNYPYCSSRCGINAENS